MLRTSSIIAAMVLVILKLTETAECDTKSECGVAETAFGMCVPYVMGDEPNILPKCCAAVNSVKELSTTPMARRGICQCLQQFMARVGKTIYLRAAELPGKCNVVTNVIPTGIHFPCNKIS